MYSTMEVCLKAGVSERRVNYLIRTGKLPRPTIKSGVRQWTDEDVGRLKKLVEVDK